MTDRIGTIAIAASGLSHVRRGIETWACELAAALHARGRKVVLCKGSGTAVLPYEHILPCWRRDARRTRFLMQLLPKHFVWRFGLGSHYGVEQTTFALRLLPYLRKRQIGLLHVQDPLVALVVHRAQRRGLVPTQVILGHGTEETWETLHELDFVQQLAPWHLAQAQQAGVAKATWTAIPNFVDVDRFRPGTEPQVRQKLGIPLDHLVVFVSAALKTRHKRIDYLLNEFAMLRKTDPNVPVWLVAAGSRESDTDTLVRMGRTVLGDRVRFLVNVPRDEMPGLYRAADVFVLSSLFEMMPIALLEAIASGLPCLVNHHDVLQWMVGPAGISLDMSRGGELASALLALLQTPHQIRALAEAARSHCQAQFSRDAVVDQLLEYYGRIVEIGSQSGGFEQVGRRAS